MDDETKDWDFQAFERVVSEMESANTTVGGILGAMVYQIEEANKQALDPLDRASIAVIKKGSQHVLPRELNRHSTNAVLSVDTLPGDDPR